MIRKSLVHILDIYEPQALLQFRKLRFLFQCDTEGTLIRKFRSNILDIYESLLSEHHTENILIRKSLVHTWDIYDQAQGLKCIVHSWQPHQFFFQIPSNDLQGIMIVQEVSFYVLALSQDDPFWLRLQNQPYLEG